jgi:hypothetical protein
MKRAAALLAIGLVALSAFAALTLPPEQLALEPFEDGSVAGILHIHTNRSDGRGAPEDIAATAARAGVRFIVFTDHGDATRPPDPPVYRSGVLCIDGVEISTAGGHYIALDMPPAPYPLGGEARDVVEDVRRLGGFGIVAHPDSPKPGLHWSAWESEFDAVEWINPDTSWRVRASNGWRGPVSLLGGLLHYPFRPGETLARLLTGFEETMSRWTSISATRRVVGLAGTDSHAKLAIHDADPGDNRFTIPLPGYDATFRLLSVRAILARPLSGDAASDTPLVIEALRQGHVYTAIDGLAAPPALTFTATNARGPVQQGDEIAAGSPVSLQVRSNAPRGFTTIVWRGGEVLRSIVSSGAPNAVTIDAGGEPAVYRAEVRTADARTWLLSNAIYVRGIQDEITPEARTPPVASRQMFDGSTDAGWHLETDRSSLAAVDVARAIEGYELRVRFGLSPNTEVSPWAALVWGTPIGQPPTNVANFERLRFVGRAEKPMRISVQLRTANGGGLLRRWQRSAYLDTANREYVVHFDELSPSPGTDAPRPPLDQIAQILFVVDTTNAKPGSSGRFWITRAALEK